VGLQNSPREHDPGRRTLPKVGTIDQENGMSGLSTSSRVGECREIVFWVLLLGSWQLLASPGSKTGIIGAVGVAAFLVYAWANIDRLRGLGLDHARWRSAARTAGCLPP